MCCICIFFKYLGSLQRKDISLTTALSNQRGTFWFLSPFDEKSFVAESWYLAESKSVVWYLPEPDGYSWTMGWPGPARPEPDSARHDKAWPDWPDYLSVPGQAGPHVEALCTSTARGQFGVPSRPVRPVATDFAGRRRRSRHRRSPS